jgi:hypothetical protein
MAQKQELTVGKGAIVSCHSECNHPSLWVQNHHVNIKKCHQLERMKVLQRELKKIKGKEVMVAIEFS